MRFEGGKELAAALAGLSARVSKSLVKEVLMDAAEPMRKTMSRLVASGPVAPHIKDNIVISPVRAKRDEFGLMDTRQTVAVGPARFFQGSYSYTTKKGKRVTEGASFQAYLLEFGTSKMGAQPFVRPAFDQHAEKTIADIGRRLWVELASKGIQRPSTTSSGPVIGGPGGGLL